MRNEKKTGEKVFGILMDLCAVVVLVVVAAGTFRYMKREYFPRETGSDYVDKMERDGHRPVPACVRSGPFRHLVYLKE